MALVPPSSAKNCEVGNQDVAAGEFDFAEPLVEHAVKPAGFFRIALHAVATVRKWLNCWGIGPKPPICHISHSSTGIWAARLPFGQNFRSSPRGRSGLRRIQIS